MFANLFALVMVLASTVSCGKKDKNKDQEDPVTTPALQARLVANRSEIVCDQSSNGALYFISEENAFVICDQGSLNNINVKGDKGETGSTGNTGSTGSTGSTGATGAGYSKLNLSSVTATAVGTNGGAYTGTAPGSLANFTDAADFALSNLSSTSVATTAGTINATASVNGCLKVDLGAHYSGNAYAKIRLSTASGAITGTIRWETSPDNSAWYLGSTQTISLTTTAKDLYPTTPFSARYVTLCVQQPAAGMQIINFTGYQILITYL